MKNSIKMHRANKGVTQQGLAEVIGVSKQSIVAIEHGKYVPSTVLALKMARYFETPIEELFELEEGE
ncbi:helix-turn-helix transcriptional regulator [Bacteroidia bacterium]|nr:helix-turn-helix transcriptional regulator [Bacteroidia bacterium]